MEVVGAPNPGSLNHRGATVVTAEERALLAFFSVEGIGPVTLEALRVAFGDLAEALRRSKNQILPHLQTDRARACFRAVPDPGALADRHLQRASDLGARLLFPGRPDWPVQLQGLNSPPLLYVRGTLAPEARRVAVVGSRKTDSYGEELTSLFAGGLAAAGVVVVSGGALGVDAMAHRAALGNNGATVAVLGAGIDQLYPEENLFVFEEMVARGGALVTHFPPGTPAVRQNFQVRNKVIAALSDAVLVTRAQPGSGALGTAQAALALNRPVFAIPGDVTCELSGGVNGLIEAGHARAVSGLEPVALALGLEGKHWPSAAPRSNQPGLKVRSRAPLPPPSAPDARRPSEAEARALAPHLAAVLAALGDLPRQFDELLVQTSLATPVLSQSLLELELLGFCEEREGRQFVRTAPVTR